MSKNDYRQNQQEEVDKNYEVFQKKIERGEIDIDLYGKFALMKGGKIIDYFDSWGDANKAGDLAFKDKLYSIQHVTDNSVNLGYYSYAIT